MAHWWFTVRVGRLIFLRDCSDAGHETTPKHLLKHLSGLLYAPYFYLTIMGGLVVIPIN
jgi:hypothetical protein